MRYVNNGTYMAVVKAPEDHQLKVIADQYLALPDRVSVQLDFVNVS